MDRATLNMGIVIEQPTKAYLHGTTCLLFPDGFVVEDNAIRGLSQRFDLDDADERLITREVSLDSIALMTSYELESSPSMVLGSIMVGVFGGILTPLSIYCLACPKCCFGSCPTVHIDSGFGYEMIAELFSSNISRYHQDNDIDLLSDAIIDNDIYEIRLTNEALETHYINQLSLAAVRHPAGTSVFATSDNQPVIFQSLSTPSAAENRIGTDVLFQIRDKDDGWYRSDSTMVEQIKEGMLSDWIDLTLPVPAGSSAVNLVVRMRNTLMGTILFYDLVLASQGIEALNWIERINSDEQYSDQFYRMYDRFSGIEVQLYEDGLWQTQARITDTGPIAWSERAVQIPVRSDHDEEMTVRLQFFPDYFMIDTVFFDVVSDATIPADVAWVRPSRILDYSGAERNDILNLIEEIDDTFLITEPGEEYRLLYEITPAPDEMTAVFLKSAGYYTEWLRGDWITNEPTAYQFNLLKLNETIQALADSWLENRALMERTFFQSKIPVRK
ncbi:hypothetical protein ACFL3X_00780 [Gemmatimonadota bacterium]